MFYTWWYMGALSSLILYLLVYGCSTLCFHYGVLYRKEDDHFASELLFLIGALIVSVFAAIRYHVGTDYQNYVYIYEGMSSGTLLEGLTYKETVNSFGTFIIARIAMYCGGVYAFFGLYAFCVSYFGIRIIACKYSHVPIGIAAFLFLIGPFTSSLNIMKQIMASVIVLYAFEYLYNRSFWKYLVFICLAMLFHTTAVVMIAVYFLFPRSSENGEYIKGLSYVLVLLAAICVLFFDEIVLMVTKIPLFAKFAHYVIGAQVTGRNLSFFYKLIIVCGLFFIRSKLVDINENNYVLFLLTVIGLIIEFTGFSGAFLKRLSIYFYSIPELLLLSQVSLVFKEEDRRVIQWCIVGMEVLLFILIYVILGQADLIPYRTVFNSMCV